MNLTNEQQEWFDAQTASPENVNPCVRLFGRGPAGQSCRGCVHLVAHRSGLTAPLWLSEGLAELQSAHCYAAEFGTVLEWCSDRTDDLFSDKPAEQPCNLTGWDREPLSAWAEAELAYRLVRDARQVERRLGRLGWAS